MPDQNVPDMSGTIKIAQILSPNVKNDELAAKIIKNGEHWFQLKEKNQNQSLSH